MKAELARLQDLYEQKSIQSAERARRVEGGRRRAIRARSLFCSEALAAQWSVMLANRILFLPEMTAESTRGGAGRYQEEVEGRPPAEIPDGPPSEEVLAAGPGGHEGCAASGL